MAKLSISLQPQSCGKTYPYNYCELTLELCLKKPLKKTDCLTVVIYNSLLMPLFCVRTESDVFEKDGRTLRFKSSDTNFKKRLWLPGQYFALLRDQDGNVERLDLQLDEEGVFHTLATRPCPKMSDEDMLSGRLLKTQTQWFMLAVLPGILQLKRWVVEKAKLCELNEMRSNMQLEPLKQPANLLVTACDPRCVRRAITLMMHIADSQSKREFANLNTFFDSSKGDPYEAMREFFSDSHSSGDFFSLLDSSTKAHTYVFSGPGCLTESGGKVIMKTILDHWNDAYDNAVFYGTRQELTAMLDLFPTLQDRFPQENRLHLEPLTREEMLYAFFEKAAQAHLTFSPEATDKVCRLLTKAYEQGRLSHWTAIDIADLIGKQLVPTFCQNAIKSLQDGLNAEADATALVEVKASDIDRDIFLRTDSRDADAMQQLQDMVGLADVKQSIRSLASAMAFRQNRRMLGLPAADRAVYHTILTGNPGTGKTTVARLLGKIYHSLGLLSKGNVVCADRSTIIGRYIGETEENMKQLLREARGGVLFIDEAYTLYTEHDKRDFGRHAVESLLTLLSQKDPDMLVVFAGYKKEMDTLLTMNPGLAGRFPCRFHLPDYTAEELMQIAEKLLAADQYRLTAEARSALQQAIREAHASRSEHFANARWVGDLISGGIIPALADRLASSPHAFDKATFSRIEAADVRTAVGKFCTKAIFPTRHRAIGFCA